MGDAAYDDTEWFKKAKSLGINLLTDVNMRRTDSIESFKDQERYKNALFLKSPIGQKLYKKQAIDRAVVLNIKRIIQS